MGLSSCLKWHAESGVSVRGERGEAGMCVEGRDIADEECDKDRTSFVLGRLVSGGASFFIFLKRYIRYEATNRLKA